MDFDQLLENPADWMKAGGPNGDIVMTSRVRLARNIRNYPFPGWARKEDRVQIWDKVKGPVEGLRQMENAFVHELSDLSAIQKQVLVERHLISREHAAKGGGCGAVMDDRQNVSIMINEEDHLRMQSVRPGLNLKAAYQLLDGVDTELEEHLEYAFDSDLGYLTACPTNLGTGMRASAMLHLPALVLSEQINPVIQAVNKIGLAVRGLYGEGTEALANLFQISNQNTLGEEEGEIVARLHKVIEQIIDHERNARLKLQEERMTMLRDQIGRAYAVLRYAHVIQSKEALNLLSMLRLGADIGFLPETDSKLMDQLLMEIQPAHLQVRAQKKLEPDARDQMRAEIMRRKLKCLPDPDMLPGRGGGDSDEAPEPPNTVDDDE